MRKYLPISFADAKAFVMDFGKSRGKTLDAIASTDNGLMYLDWLRGIHLDFHTKNAVNSYLDDPLIAKDLAKIIDTKKGN